MSWGSSDSAIVAVPQLLSFIASWVYHPIHHSLPGGVDQVWLIYRGILRTGNIQLMEDGQLISIK